MLEPSPKWLIAAFLLTLGSPLSAEEPWRAFLGGLRARGYHEVALDYLDGMTTSRLAPADLKPMIPYERALTLVDFSRSQRDLEVRFRYLDDAQQLLRQFVDTRASHPKAHAARSQLGNLIVERARIKVEQAKSGNTKALLKQAQEAYQQAFQEFTELESVISAELNEIPKVLDVRDKEQAALAERRKQLRADNLQTELLAAAIREESADTVPDDPAQQASYLSEAARMYDQIYKKYRSRLAGLYARMYQGRCNHRLGKTKDALGYYGELLDQPDEPEEMRVLKTATLRLAMESWLAPGEQKYMEAIKQATGWLATVPRGAEREPDMLAIRFSLAKAYKLQADDLEGREPRDTRAIALSIEEAKKHAKFVAGESGDLREEAQQLLVKLGVRPLQSAGPPETFAAAQEAGRKALGEIGPASEQVATLQGRLRNTEPTRRAEIQQQLDAAEQKLSAARATAMQSYRLAMRLADQNTPPSELNLVRYFVCYLYYLNRDHFEAALIGDFVSQYSPQSDAAKPCAQIALACYMAILESSTNQDRSFEINRLVATTNYIADTWPDSPETIEALTKLVPVLVNAAEYQQARQLTMRIPQSDPGRGQCELVTGQAIWGQRVQRQQQIQALQRSGESQDTDLASKESELDELTATATELLVSGYARLPRQPQVTLHNATALLSLAQAHVAASQYSEAAEVLEHPVLGPITLVDAGDGAVSDNPVFVEEAYRTALEAYVGSQEMENAKAVMASLQQTARRDAAGKQRMMGVYANLAQSVESQMKSADPDARQELSQVFEAFLEELSAGSSDVGVLNWVAETFASLGSGFDDDPSVLNQDASRYYQRSIAAFENLLRLSTLDPQLATQLKARLAAVKAQNHDFEDALNDFSAILSQKPNAVNIQVDAARLLQRWAGTDPAKYTEAISGIRRDGKSVIWGWAKIASSTLQYKQFRETFYEARYEMAKCQMGLAQSKRGEERNRLLASAERNLKRTRQLYPTLGGQKWTKLYDDLLQQVQSAR